MRYYAPTLQHKKLLWESMIPQLKKNSEMRISQNNDYQSFIKGTPVERRRINPSDLQLAEAAAIMKDMITLQSQLRGNEHELQGSSAQTAGILRERVQE
jgi:hypothetical protein